MDIGVYRIRNIVNGKVYIGSATISIKRRWKRHLRNLQTGKHHSRHLQAAWNKYGGESFVFEVIFPCLPDECLVAEQILLDEARSYLPEYGYNMTTVAGNVTGHKLTQDVKDKLRRINTGKKASEETKKKMREAVIGKTMSEDAIAKIKLAKSSDEHRKMMSDLTKAQWLDDELKARQAAAINKTWSDEALRAEQSERLKAIWADPEVRAKHLAARRTDEARKKNSDAQKAAWARRKERKLLGENNGNDVAAPSE